MNKTIFDKDQAAGEAVTGREMPVSNVVDIQHRWMRSAETPAHQTLSPNELTSLNALIAYVAYQSGSSEFRIERNLADKFNVPNAKFLPTDQFDSAIRYLVDTFSA